ncbi:MAG: hypothetical protein FWE67_00845 [Planctomycetaceae bacterium]|nr:hypothetical protein [Planctomycetaceae bacterium]
MKNNYFSSRTVLFCTLLIALCFTACGRNTTTEAYRQTVIREINGYLQNESDERRRYIEFAHQTVTVTSATVTSCQIETLDGSNNAGYEGKNVSRVTYEITAYWDGVFHKQGHSVLKIVSDVQNGKSTAKIIKTDAVVNIEDPNFWYEAGFAAGVIGFGLF